eukprot:1158573-Pelagomonas_calceolata.AAC.5
MDVLASARQAVDVWAPLAHHPAIVGLRRAFVTSDYDPQAQPALCFAYDFLPGTCECVRVCVSVPEMKCYCWFFQRPAFASPNTAQKLSSRRNHVFR